VKERGPVAGFPKEGGMFVCDGWLQNSEAYELRPRIVPTICTFTIDPEAPSPLCFCPTLP
jgi:hypothetical protein